MDTVEKAVEKAEAERAREEEAERAEDVAEAGRSDSAEVTVTVMVMVGGVVAIVVAIAVATLGRSEALLAAGAAEAATSRPFSCTRGCRECVEVECLLNAKKRVSNAKDG